MKKRGTEGRKGEKKERKGGKKQRRKSIIKT